MYLSQVEMELLEPNELDYFYWYWDYVLSIHVWASSKLKESKYALEMELYRQKQQQALIEGTKNLSVDSSATNSAGTAGGKSKKKKAKKPVAEQVAPSKPRAADEKMPEKEAMVKYGICLQFE